MFGFFKTMCFDRLSQRYAFKLPESQFCETARYTKMPCDIRHPDSIASVNLDERLCAFDQSCRWKNRGRGGSFH